jgi:7-carboxy-7-deazaguanine synthase
MRPQTTTLPVMEHFYTIQGEGYHQGKAAYFVRLGGCDVGCTWCDVKDSWDAAKHPKKSITTIIKSIQKSGANLAVITGGEPLLHNLNALTAALKKNNIATNIETSGSSPLTGLWDWICLSPKKFKQPLPQVIAAANELKIIIYNQHDFKWAETFAKQVPKNCRLYLQPEWSKKETMLPHIVNYVLQNPKWQISIQMHKYINVD